MGTEALGMGTSSGIIMQHTEKQWALAVGVTWMGLDVINYNTTETEMAWGIVIMQRTVQQ